MRGLGEFEELLLAGAPVANLSTLAGLAKLQRFQLAETRVQDVTPLFGLGQLELLDVRGLSIPEEQLISLEQSHPHLTIIRAAPPAVALRPHKAVD